MDLRKDPMSLQRLKEASEKSMITEASHIFRSEEEAKKTISKSPNKPSLFLSKVFLKDLPIFPVEPEIIPEEPEPVMDIQPDAEPEMTSEAVPAFEPEPKSEAVQSSAGCGAGTVMVNGVCQVAKTSGTSMAIEPMYIVIAAVAIGGGAVGAIFAVTDTQRHCRYHV